MGRPKSKIKSKIEPEKKNLSIKTFNGRKGSILKKAEELSILCQTDVLVIMYIPGYRNPITWPENPEKLHPIINKYLRTTLDERSKRSLGLFEILKQKNEKVEDELAVLRKSANYPTWDDCLDCCSNEELREFMGKLDCKIDSLKKRVELLKEDKGKFNGQIFQREMVNFGRKYVSSSDSCSLAQIPDGQGLDPLVFNPLMQMMNGVDWRSRFDQVVSFNGSNLGVMDGGDWNGGFDQIVSFDSQDLVTMVDGGDWSGGIDQKMPFDSGDLMMMDDSDWSGRFDQIMSFSNQDSMMMNGVDWSAGLDQFPCPVFDNCFISAPSHHHLPLPLDAFTTLATVVASDNAPTTKFLTQMLIDSYSNSPFMMG